VFSFGIITDTHIRAPQGDLSSPYAVNDLANERARYAAELLAAQKPDFVVHLGDMVHPLPGMPVYNAACQEAKSLLEPLGSKLHFVPGNHDVGDKPNPGAPAAEVTSESIKIYEKEFGASYKSFVHKNCCIVIINSSLVNTGTTEDIEQFEWLESTLAKNAGKRIIVFSHYPLFVHDIQEPEHYDNIAQPGRHNLLWLIQQHEVEMVFSGHVHHFFYSRVKHTQELTLDSEDEVIRTIPKAPNKNEGCDFYILPPTSFTRQDYSELFKADPAAEFGRDDTDKYSVAMVHVSDEGHELELIPTNGISLSADSTGKPALKKVAQPIANNLMVSWRHAWHESTFLPYNGPMEEFSRKQARNDYGLLRMLQMGIKDVRVPLQDLTDEAARLRLQQYHSLGIRFHVFSLDTECHELVAAVESWGDSVHSIECVLTSRDSLWLLDLLESIKSKPLTISYASSGAHQSASGKPFAHSVSTGFNWAERKEIFKAIGSETNSDRIDKIMFQIPIEADLQATIKDMETVFDTLPWKGLVYLRLADSNPAMANFDDELIEQRVTTALDLIASSEKLSLCLDTFMDVDRGYSPRHGLIDRRSNLRPVGKAIAAREK